MNSKMYALLAYCFVMAIINVTGNDDTPRHPQKIQLQLPIRPTGYSGQLSRSPDRFGEILSDYDDSQINEEMYVNAILRQNVNNYFGPFHNRDTSRYQYENSPREFQQPLRRLVGDVSQLSRPIFSVGQKLLPDYGYSQINEEMYVNAILRPNVNSEFGLFYNRETSRYQYVNSPREFQQPLLIQPVGDVSQLLRSIAFVGQILPDYKYSQINVQINVMAIYHPNVYSNVGSLRYTDTSQYHYGNPPRELQRQFLQPTGSVRLIPQPDYDQSQINEQNNVNFKFPNMYTGSLSKRDTLPYQNKNLPRELQQPLPTQPADNDSQLSLSIGSFGQKVLPEHNHSQTNEEINVNAKLLPNVNNTVGSSQHLPEDAIVLKRPTLSNDTDDMFLNNNLTKVFTSSPRTDGPIKHQITNTSEFGHEAKESGAPLKMNISFILSTNVHRGFALLRSSLRDLHSKKSFEIRQLNLSDETNDKVATVQWSVTREPQLISIHVQLYNKTGVCLNKRISKEIVFQKKLNKSNLDYGNSLICLYEAKCLIEVDLRNECEEHLPEDAIVLKRPTLSNDTDDMFLNNNLTKVFTSSPRTDGPIKPQITNTSEFGHEAKKSGASLKMNISFILSTNVHRGFALLQSSLKDLHSKKSFEIRQLNLSDETNDKVATVQWSVTREPQRISIHVQLYNKTGECFNQTIPKEIVFQKKFNKSNLDYGNSWICLYGAKCLIEVDLWNECEGAEHTDATDYKTIIITISASLLAIVLIILAIVAYFKRCWIKVDASKKFQKLPIPKTMPFYVNLLFRDECQKIIDDLEQNHYELID